MAAQRIAVPTVPARVRHLAPLRLEGLPATWRWAAQSMDTAHKEITARVTTVDIRLGLSRPVLRLVQPQAQRGGVLLIWDHLFGSYQAEQPNMTIRYGLAHASSSPNNPFVIAYEELWLTLKAAFRSGSLREHLARLLGPP